MVHGKKQPVFITWKFLNPCNPQKISSFWIYWRRSYKFCSKQKWNLFPRKSKNLQVNRRTLFPTHTDRAYNHCNVHLDWFTATFPCPNSIPILPTTTFRCIHLHSFVWTRTLHVLITFWFCQQQHSVVSSGWVKKVCTFNEPWRRLHCLNIKNSTRIRHIKLWVKLWHNKRSLHDFNNWFINA